MTFNPNLGRWMETDPIGIDGGDKNLYRFDANSPPNLTDPFGLKVSKVSVEEVVKPRTQNWGAVLWGVNFKLDDKADETCGGWIIQHLIRVITDKKEMKEFERLDYWEAWRVEPKATGVAPTEITNKKALADLKIAGIDPEGKANDWFAARRYPESTGEIVWTGKVYYIDAMKESDLPETWKNDYPPAAPLRAIRTEGHEKEIKELLDKFKKTTVGPTDHNLTVSWSVDAIETKIEKKTP